MSLSDQDLLDLSEYEEIFSYSHNEDIILDKNSERYSFYKELRDRFWVEIYFKRENIEKNIKAKLEISSKILSIEGITGCGKSTIIRKILKDLDTTFYILIDFNEKPITIPISLNEKRELDYWLYKIGEELKLNICGKFFDENDDLKYHLYDLALFSNEEFFRKRFFYERLEIRNIVHGLKDLPEITSKNIKNHSNGNEKKEVDKIFGIVFRKADYKHLIFTIKNYFKSSKKFMVILDNVDNLPSKHQQYCYEFAILFNNLPEIKYLSQMLICIRKENAHRARSIPNCGAENVIPIHMGDVGYEDFYTNYLDQNMFYQIIEARQKYYTDRRTNNISRRTNFILKNIKGAYNELILIDLANQSIKTALSYHLSYVRFLLKNFEDDYLNNIFSDADPYVKSTFLYSCFLGWIAIQRDILDGKCLNIVRNIQNSIRKNYLGMNCDLGYLILSYLYNALEEGGKDVYADNIIYELTSIGFDEEQIRKKIFDLYRFGEKGFGHIVNISSDFEIKNENDIISETLISINYRGICLLKYIIISFTFINRLLFNTDEYFDKKLIEKYYDFDSFIIHTKNNIVFYAKVAFLHSLELLCISLRMNNANWLRTYKEKFGVYNIKKSKYLLHLERIIISSKEKFLITIKIIFKQKNEKNYKLMIRYIEILDKLYLLYKKQISLIENKNYKIYNFENIVKKMLYLKKEISDFDLDDSKIEKIDVSDIIPKKVPSIIG